MYAYIPDKCTNSISILFFFWQTLNVEESHEVRMTSKTNSVNYRAHFRIENSFDWTQQQIDSMIKKWKKAI